MYSVHWILCTVQWTLSCLHCTVYSVHWILCTVQSTLTCLHCTVNTELLALYSVHWVLCTIQCSVYSVQCTVYSVHRIVCKSYRIITYLLSGLQLWPPGQDFHIVFSCRWSIVVKENDGGSILNSVFALCTAGLCTAWGELGIVLQNIRFKFQKSMPMQNQQYTFLN